jgi:hypothetical protein
LHVLLCSQCSTSLHETVPQFLVKVGLEKPMYTLWTWTEGVLSKVSHSCKFYTPG